ncbi:hypothetical protein [Chryseobacterium sp. Leaf201]|uniref:hypothetical protein n=1 Tax=Chryseobacterium sp. Leaf201 TaxID=1735672 RepID=UPI00070049A7|nr:hypothetical protein [Chryseobacterium sp. Leaf201]KQM47076.1 hypothetical protein ASE55_10775 [Chryseobacterium sp. Leaf201]
MEKIDITITECFKCGARYENYFNASPCCRAIILKVDEHGNRTTITFLSTLSMPSSDFVTIEKPEQEKVEMSEVS